MKTPIILLTFNRPDLTRRVLEAVRSVRPPVLFVSSDGPRRDRPADEPLIAEVRRLLDGVDWPCEVLRDYTDENEGCTRRVSTALTRAFEQLEEAIVLEDDCLPHPDFFRFCEEMLARYRDDERVFHIGGNNFWRGGHRTELSYVFSRYSHIWGWATWRRAWSRYDGRLSTWHDLRRANRLTPLLGDPDQASHWAGAFDEFVRDPARTHSWDLAWLFTCFAAGALSVYPRVNLVTNLGFRADATHTTAWSAHFAELPVAGLTWPLVHPPHVVQDFEADLATFVTCFKRPRRRLTERAIEVVAKLRRPRGRRHSRLAEAEPASLCPLTGSSDVVLTATIDTTGLVERWQHELGIDVSRRFVPVDRLLVYRSRPVDLHFFRPLVLDDAALYVELQRNAWYYDATTWEHELAFDQLSRRLPRGARLLEFGSGIGTFLARCQDAGFVPIGVELNPTAATAARSRGLTVLESHAADEALDPASFDAVTAFQVLEHVADPRALLTQMARLLRPGGLLFLAVPDHDSFLGDLVSILNLPPHHQTWWTERTFRALASFFPFELIGSWSAPLADVHVESFLEAQARRIEARGGSELRRLLVNRVTRAVTRRALRAGLSRHVRGHSIGALFRRRDEHGAPWKAENAG